jgi:vacuolar-type H+-ATPase subunit F/Vma7
MFIPKVQEGTLESKKTLKVPIKLVIPVPTVKKNEYNYTERLVLKVLDGI